MGQFGGFYKGDKRKSKKGKDKKPGVFSSTPTFTLPEIVGRGKKE